MDLHKTLDSLRGRDVVLFVADEGEISQDDVRFPVIYTGIGKLKMYGALERWYAGRNSATAPLVLNIGSAGSAKFPIGEIVGCGSFVNGVLNSVKNDLVKSGKWR